MILVQRLFLFFSYTDIFGMRRNKVKLFIGAIISVITIYFLLNQQNWAWYNRSGSSSGPSICRTPEREMKDLISLAHDTRHILQNLNMTYFLIYGRLVFIIYVAHYLEYPMLREAGI